MITGDNPLTAVSVAQQVEIVDRDTLIIDQREGSNIETGTFSEKGFESMSKLSPRNRFGLAHA